MILISKSKSTSNLLVVLELILIQMECLMMAHKVDEPSIIHFPFHGDYL